MNKNLEIRQGIKMPEDFWNYLVNPIVGYYVPSVFNLRGESSFRVDTNKKKTINYGS